MIEEKADIEKIYNHIKVLEARYKKNVDSHLFFPLADAYVKADMLDQAEIILREGLSNHPKYCAAKALLGEVFFKRGNLMDAQNQLEEVVEIVPDNIMAHKLLIEVYKRTGLQDRYERELRTLKMIDQADFKGKKISESIIKDEAMLEKETSMDEAKDKQSGLFQKTGDEADSVSTEAFHEEGKDEIITATLAEMYFSQGFFERSIEIYKKLLIQQPDQEKWAKRLAEIHEIHKNSKMDSEILPDRIMNSEGEDKKEKILLTLEKWLENCQRMKKTNS